MAAAAAIRGRKGLVLVDNPEVVDDLRIRQSERHLIHLTRVTKNFSAAAAAFLSVDHDSASVIGAIVVVLVRPSSQLSGHDRLQLHGVAGQLHAVSFALDQLLLLLQLGDQLLPQIHFVVLELARRRLLLVDEVRLHHLHLKQEPKIRYNREFCVSGFIITGLLTSSSLMTSLAFLLSLNLSSSLLSLLTCSG